jgi:hypothetical protein
MQSPARSKEIGAARLSIPLKVAARIDVPWGLQRSTTGQLEVPTSAWEEMSDRCGGTEQKAQGRVLGQKLLFSARSSPPRHIWVEAA